MGESALLYCLHMTDVSPPVPPDMVDRLAALQARLWGRSRVRFRDEGLLYHALIHRSAVNERLAERLTSNERLEFLGDAVLGSVVAERLYRQYPHFSEGKLTVTRAELVRQSTLARWAREIGLGLALVLGRGEELGGVRDRDGPLASAFEAVVGAIYLDRGLNTVARVLERFVAPELEQVLGERPLLDAKSRLQQSSQTEYDAMPTYRVVETQGPQHSPTFTVEVCIRGEAIARGTGRSKQAAQQQAAEAALSAWDEQGPPLDLLPVLTGD